MPLERLCLFLWPRRLRGDRERRRCLRPPSEDDELEEDEDGERLRDLRLGLSLFIEISSSRSWDIDWLCSSLIAAELALMSSAICTRVGPVAFAGAAELFEGRDFPDTKVILAFDWIPRPDPEVC